MTEIVHTSCPHCDYEPLTFEKTNWTDGDGDAPSIGVVCTNCGAEVEVRYEFVEAETRVLPDGAVV